MQCDFKSIVACFSRIESSLGRRVSKWIAIGCVAFLISSLGCAKWTDFYHNGFGHQGTGKANGLPPFQPADDAIPIEMIFLRLGADQIQDLQNVWPRVDEQSFPIELRKKLDRNGIRVAMVDGVVPIQLQRLIDSVDKKLKEDPLEQAGVTADLTSHSRLLSCRTGERKEISVRPSRKGTMVLLHNDGGAARGKTYEDPSLLLELRMFAKGDGTGVLHLQPEVQYGPYKQKIVGQDFALRREMRRDSDTWPDLAIQHPMRNGSDVVGDRVDASQRIGRAFFLYENGHG